LPFEPDLVIGNQYKISPTQTTTFEASISDTSGQCTKSDTASVEVVEILCGPPFVFIPNAFTPNNDGENDVLYVRGREITEMYLAIFNRWGELVFESRNLNDGWNGFFKGERCDPAVYDYYLEYSCDGVNEQFMKGNITLIR
jgi:gliding motility-associated-like protein